ncbi:MAG: twin-arginine translocase TatA/TatE family subunit [Chloroflexi bacterium]|nr:twin-arginine translocase TatA/TatE family subunit [Chloroflexota bacterium]
MFGAGGHLPELIILVILALIILGPGKLPQVGGALGKTIREFRKGAQEVDDPETTKTATTPSDSAAKSTVPSEQMHASAGPANNTEKQP